MRSIGLEGGNHGGCRVGCMIGRESPKDLGDRVAKHGKCIMSEYAWLQK